MKIAFASDFHFGYSEDALAQAAEALRKAGEDADVVVLAGDLFDSRVPRQEVIHDAIRLLSEHKAKMQEKAAASGTRIRFLQDGEESLHDFPIIGIYGTHERRTKGLVNVIQILHSAGLILNVHAATAIVEKDGEKVAVQGMGGMPDEFVKRALDAMDFKPLAGAFNVFVFHQTLKELIPVAVECICAADLPKGFDLYVDGHIHWAQEFTEAGKHLVLPGSTVITQMKPKEMAPKGYYLYDTASKQLVFKPIRTRPFVYEELSFKEAASADVEASCRAKLKEIAAAHAGKQPLVRLKLSGTLAKGISATALDLSGLEKEFEGQMQLFAEKEFEGAELKEKIEALRRARGEQASLRDAGVSLLRERLEARNSPFAGDEELFSLLAEGEPEAVLKKLLKK
ncbi:MAG: metallophosphoesterase [Candidatus Micrarchaeota archaeon]